MSVVVLERQRKTIDYVLSPLSRRLIKVHPDFFTWSSVIFAFAAGCLFVLSTPENEVTTFFLCGAACCVFLNGLFDALDGKIAKVTNTASPRGDFLDHALDRYADVLIVGGLSLSAWCDLRLGLLAIAGMLLTSYMGTQAQAVGYGRDYGGYLGRADRLALLIIAPVLQHILLRLTVTLPLGFTLLEWILIYFAVMGNITALQRFIRTLHWFKRMKNEGQP